MQKLGTDTGSLINHLLSAQNGPAPEVGMGCTVLCWTDRKAATVVKVFTPQRIIVQFDQATRTDNNGMSDAQTYAYEPDPNGAKYEFRFGKKGWREKGGTNGLVLGRRDHYHDYSF